MLASSSRATAFLATLLCLGCSKEKEQPARQVAAPPSPASAAPAPPKAPAPSTDGASRSCRPEAEKLWQGRPSLLTGLTSTRFDDGRFAVGVWLSGRPQVVVFDRQGRGEVLRVPTREALRAAPKQGTTRTVLRVTPALGANDAVVAFVDSRDETEERRTVHCGRADSEAAIVSFEGERLPLPEAKTAKRDDSVRRQYAAAAEQPQQGGVRLDPKGNALRLRRRTPKGRPGESNAKSVKEARQRGAFRAKTQTEVLDCRSLVEPGGVRGWAAGTQATLSRSEGYRVQLFVERPADGGRLVLHTQELGDSPKRLDAFESVTAAEVGGGRFVLAARYRGSLMAWLLEEDRNKQGPVRTYSGGSPTLPRFGRAEGPVLLTSVRGKDGDYALRYLEVGDTLAASLRELRLDADTKSPSEPSLASLGDRRLLSYQFGERTAAGLGLVPVDAALQPAGPAIEVAPAEEAVKESLITPLDDARTLIVYLRAPKGQPELVSRVVCCDP